MTLCRGCVGAGEGSGMDRTAIVRGVLSSGISNRVFFFRREGGIRGVGGTSGGGDV